MSTPPDHSKFSVIHKIEIFVQHQMDQLDSCERYKVLKQTNSFTHSLECYRDAIIAINWIIPYAKSRLIYLEPNYM